MSTPKISKILCPTDFSPFAGRALGAAISLARQHAAEIEAIHVFPIFVPFATGDVSYCSSVIPVDPAARKAASDELSRFVATARDAGVPASMAILEGDPFTVILDRAMVGGADLVAMGTHGRRGFDRWLMGSVAERMLAKSHCPVLTVAALEPGETSKGSRRPVSAGLKRVLCALDLLSQHSAKTLAYASFLATKSRARLSVLYVTEELSGMGMPGEALSSAPFEREFRKHLEEEGRKKLEAFVPGSAEGIGEIERIVVSGEAHREILRTAYDHGSDLIVMGVHGRAALGVSMLGSTARHVVREAPCPVITVRPD